MWIRNFILAVLVCGSLGGCATFKGLFTDQGKKLAQAQTLADSGHFLGASALASEALAQDPDYPEARALLVRTYPQGQQEFQESLARLDASPDPARWDTLVGLYRWENTLHEHSFGQMPVPVSVKKDLAEASREASLYHWTLAQDLLNTAEGPRQARKALAEGLKAVGFDPLTPGLSGWIEKTKAEAVQKVLVVPFTFQSAWVPGFVPGQLGSEVSRRLLEDPDLPGATTVFLSERLLSVSSESPDGTSPASQLAAMKMADDTGQNLVLLGQVTKAYYQPPRKTEVSFDRQSSVILVDPDHPNGVEKVYRARVLYTTWTEKASLTASFTLVEVATGKDVLTSVQDAEASEQVGAASFTGDRNALTADDLDALARTGSLTESAALADRVVTELAKKVAKAVTAGLE